MPLGLLRLWKDYPFTKPLGISQHSYFFLADGERDVVEKLSREDVLSDELVYETLKEYERSGIAFHREDRCFYTSVESERSIELCKSYARRTRGLDIFYAACRRDDCLYIYAEIGGLTFDMMVLSESDGRTKILTYLPSLKKLAELLFGKDKIEITEYPDGMLEIKVRENFTATLDKLVDYLRLLDHYSREPAELEEKLWSIKKEEVLPKLLRV